MMSGLTRLQQGLFKLEDATKLNKITVKKIIPINETLNWMSALEANKEGAKKIRNGGQIHAPQVVKVLGDFSKDEDIRISGPFRGLLTIARSERSSRFIKTLSPMKGG
ncbi:MAG: hypothetical protein J7J80_08645 [Thermotogae bacterium]|nr:hypothetical protein [Thermotogota bacterium]